VTDPDDPLLGGDATAATPCAGAVIRDDGGRLLLIQRGAEPARGTWSLPGGRVEAGETYAIAAAREVLEETGLMVEIGELIGLVDLGSYVIHNFHATIAGGSLAAGDDAGDARWYDPADIDAIETSPGLTDWLRRMRVL
jgi:ADP-ribose pyrophosphatase YjhB (NUDIX family)